jgi:hypothetical protein
MGGWAVGYMARLGWAGQKAGILLLPANNLTRNMAWAWENEEADGTEQESIFRHGRKGQSAYTCVSLFGCGYPFRRLSHRYGTGTLRCITCQMMQEWNGMKFKIYVA